MYSNLKSIEFRVSESAIASPSKRPGALRMLVRLLQVTLAPTSRALNTFDCLPVRPLVDHWSTLESLGPAFGGPGPSPWAPTMVSEGRWRPSDRFRMPYNLLLGFPLVRFRRRWAFQGGRLKFKKVIDLSESDWSNTHLKL